MEENKPKTHLGHWYGPAPTNTELGIGTTHDAKPINPNKLEEAEYDKGSNS